VVVTRVVIRLQYEQFNFTRLPPLTKIVFVAFAVLVPILLINMLIAMMGNTYEQIIRRSEKEWKRQVRAASVVMLTTNSTRPSRA